MTRPELGKIKLSGRVRPILNEEMKFLAVKEDHANTSVLDCYLIIPILMSKCGRQISSGEYDRYLPILKSSCQVLCHKLQL